MERVLIIGAAGRIGRVLRKGLRAPNRILRLVDIADLGEKGEVKRYTKSMQQIFPQ